MRELFERPMSSLGHITVKLWIAVAYVALVYIALLWGGGGGAQLRLTD